LVSSASIKGLLQALSIHGPKRVVLDVKSLVTNCLICSPNVRKADPQIRAPVIDK